ncbi:uncharacterized protein LOC117170627 isoform X1 [Belonocnema kinseyi]|uniref:uncharacterized protein LOC117170627 isoform X1 n=1 Tax=Belonocnema kinseyi TaxID=2817044 RepID=UPI00143D7D6F|nr:uncharacterized protein LOC117170627 isoform X1 [Belonocnema kinseyi]
MENVTNKSPGSVDYNEFEEDGNDSDLEGRLYAEIYYSNQNYDPDENFESSIKNIQDIKNACSASNETNSKYIQNNPIELKNADNPTNSSDKNCTPTKEQNDLVSAENEKVSSNVDKNLNLQKQVNLETQSNSILRECSNEIVDEYVNSQETPDKNRTPKQKTPKQKKNQTPKIMNEETEYSSPQNLTKAAKSANKKKKKSDGFPQILNNSLTTPNSRKRTLGFDKIGGGSSKRRSLESDKSLVNSASKSGNGKTDGATLVPVSLNSRKSSGDANISTLISPATMAILFPPVSTAKKLTKGRKNKKEQTQTKSIAANLNDNSKQSKKAEKSIQEEEEIIEIISTDSSNDSSEEDLPIVETPKAVRQKQNEESEKGMPMWLDISSDSDSEESIFEVPVPPKPPPPIIDLNDSEHFSSDSDDSSSDGIHDLNSKSQTKNVTFSCSTSDSEDSSGSENNSRVTKKTKVDSAESSTENYRSRLFSEQSIPTDGESSKDNCTVANETREIISVSNSAENSDGNTRSRLASEQSNPTDEASDSSYSDFPEHEKVDSIGENLILNCTQVQKGAKSLEEIKKIRQVAVSAEVGGRENISATEYHEYVEPLNDLAGPSTSKASGSVSKKKSRKTKESEKSRKSSKEKTDEEYFFEPMLDKIKAFYNDSWGGEEFSVEETQNTMRKDPRCWAILDEDWKPSLKRQRYFLNKTKCTLCRQSGHLRANCTEPKKGPICHMCGVKGHYETRCPHKVCLTCGTKQNTFRQTCETCSKLTCTLCRSRGHKKDSCPDHWRQYHHTTTEENHHPPTQAIEVMKSSSSLFCCNCTMRGHESSTCNKYRWSQHYATPPHITNYNKCDRMLPISSPNPVEVVDFTESPGNSSRNSLNNTEFENISYEEMFLSPTKDYSSSTTSNFETNPGKILFELKYNKIKMKRYGQWGHKVKIRKPSSKTQSQIVLSDLKDAKLEGLIAGTFKPKHFDKLCLIVVCDFRIELVYGKKVVVNINHYQNSIKNSFFKKIICFWARLSDEDKLNIRFNLPRIKEGLVRRLDKSFKTFEELSGDVEMIYETAESLSIELEKSVRIISKKNKRLIRLIRDRGDTMRILSQLLFKNNCALEKDALPNLRKLHTNLLENSGLYTARVSHDIYIQIYYYYTLIFGRSRHPNLDEMVKKYVALKKGSPNTSIGNSVLSENLEAAIAECSSEDLDQQQHFDPEYDNEEHVDQHVDIVDQDYVDQNNVLQDPVTPRRSLHQKPSPSIPPLLENSPFNIPQQFYPEQLGYPSPGCSNTPQTRPSQFELPVDEFIPISNYQLREFPEPSPHFNNRRRDPREYGRNPMHSFKTFNPRAPQTPDRLVSEASYLMNRALQFNLPHLQKAGIQLGELINQNRVQWKHIHHYRTMINSQHPRGFR